MIKTPSTQPLWARAFRYGLACAAMGLFVAIALFCLNPSIGFPEWGLVLCPSAIFMMGLSGISKNAVGFWMVAIVASNSVLYFLVGAVLAPLLILTKRALIQNR